MFYSDVSVCSFRLTYRIPYHFCHSPCKCMGHSLKVCIGRYAKVKVLLKCSKICLKFLFPIYLTLCSESLTGKSGIGAVFAHGNRYSTLIIWINTPISPFWNFTVEYRIFKIKRLHTSTRKRFIRPCANVHNANLACV